MKNTAKKLLLAGLLSTTLLNAEIAFDLHAQHFSKAIAGEYEGARYELPKAFVSTNLKYVDGKYLTKSNAGYINVEVKTPRSNWSTSIDAYYIMGNYYNKTRSMKWTSENGESILLSFRNDEITFEGKKVYVPGEYKRMTIALTQDGNNINLTINGVKVETVSRATFGKLKYLDVQAIVEYDNNANRYDYINGITIGSK